MMRKFIFILAPIITIGASGLLLLHFPKNKRVSASTMNVHQNVTSPSPLPTNNPPPANKLIPETGINENSGLNNALIKKYGAHRSFSIEKSTDEYAQGFFKGKQNKWWLAKNDNGTWHVVTDGYSYVNCADIVSYNFPKSIAPVCWGNNTIVYR